MSACPHHWTDRAELLTDWAAEGGWIACAVAVGLDDGWCSDISSPFADTCWPHADWEQRWADEEWRRAVAPINGCWGGDVQWEGGPW